MKKIYAIMAAAVVATGFASAQLPSLSSSIKDAQSTPVTGMTLSEAPAFAATVKTLTSDIKGQSIRKAAVSRADELENIYGEYIFTYVNAQSPFSTRPVTATIEPDGNGGVVVSSLFFDDVEPMPGVIEWRDVKFNNGTFSMPFLVIKGLANGPTPYIVNKDKTYYIALYDYDEDGLYGDDLAWMLYPETGEAYFRFGHMFGMNCGISYWTPNGDGLWNGNTLVPGADLYKKNAEMTAMVLTYDEDTESTSFVESSFPIWTYAYEGQYVDENSQPTGETFIGVFAAGWGGCGEQFRFIVTPFDESGETLVAIADEQVGWAEDATHDWYYCDVVLDEEGDPSFAWVDKSDNGLVMMAAAIGKDGEGNTVFEQSGMWALYCDAENGGGVLPFWQEGITVFDYNIFGDNGGGDDPSGINAIDNENVPAEYYNMQGVKVANPTPGQLYIVKQGSKVSKVIR